ncbi:uncharacterized protein LOC111999124 [Quercus suber]|uniref:uncharacterized protein LOC111999124 n=1 Tax=Quercus suber TaxID=58331 RepID=UPI0032DFF397
MESKSATSATVLIFLDVDNYLEWSLQVKTNLTAQGLWDVVEAANEPPKAKTDEAANEPPKAKTDEAASKAWTKKNDKALKMIQNSCTSHLCSAISMITSAKVAWDTLAAICELPKDGYIVPALETFEAWSNRMKKYLRDLHVWDIVEATTEPPTPDDEIAFKAWSKKNALALYLIWESSEAYSLIGNCTTAKTAWDRLAELIKPERGVNYVVQYVSLQKNIRDGNWDAAYQFLSSHPEAANEQISFKGWTPLHIAVLAGKMDIVEKLVDKDKQIMEDDSFTIKDEDDLTVLGCCALTRNIDMARCIIERCPILLSIENGKENLIPVVLALTNSDIIDMARYLYSETSLKDLMPGNGVNGATFITQCIYAKAFDMALDLLGWYPALAIALDFNGESPLLALASVSLAYPSGHGLVSWKKWIYNSLCIYQTVDIYQIFRAFRNPHMEKGGQIRKRVSGHGLVWNLRRLLVIKPIYELKLLHIQSNELLCQLCKALPGLRAEELDEALVPHAIVKAAKKGMIVFVDTILSRCPELVWSIETPTQRNLFMCAVLHRQIDVFRLVYKFPVKNAILSTKDSDGNNILHMAAMLESSTGLCYIPGAALQMQRELQWYKMSGDWF